MNYHPAFFYACNVCHSISAGLNQHITIIINTIHSTSKVFIHELIAID